MALVLNPDGDYTVGQIVDATDLSGRAVRAVVPAFIATTASGDSPVATPVTAAAQDATGAMKAPTYTFLGHQLGLAVDTSTGLTVPATTRYAIVQARAQAVKYRYDGNTTAPTSTVGMSLAAGGELAVDVVGIANMRFISATAGALLDVAYFS